MTEKTYPFKDDEGKIHQVGFEEMMTAKDGFLTRENGEVWKRIVVDNSQKSAALRGNPKIISDSMGFPASSLPEMRAQLEQSGVKGIEFVEEPDTEGFHQVHASSRGAMNRYVKSRECENKTRKASAVMCPQTLADSKELVSRSCKS